MVQEIAWWIGVLVSSIYIGAVWIKYGVQTSISSTYYLFGKKVYFTVLMWIITFTAAISGLGGSNYDFLLFISAASILFVGSAPDYKSLGIEHVVHLLSALVAISAATLAMWLKFNQPWVAIVYTVFAIGLSMIKAQALPARLQYRTWYIEIVCLAIVFVLIRINL